MSKAKNKRAPEDEQPIKLAEAEEAGTLPDADRRAPELPDDAGASLHRDNAKPRAE